MSPKASQVQYLYWVNMGFFFLCSAIVGLTQLMDSGSDCLFPRAVSTADWIQLRGKRANTPWGMTSLCQESCVMIIRPFLLFDIVDKHQQAARIHLQMSQFIIKKQTSSGNTGTVTKCILEWTSVVTGTFIRAAPLFYLFSYSEEQYNPLHHRRFHQTGTLFKRIQRSQGARLTLQSHNLLSSVAVCDSESNRRVQLDCMIWNQY